MDSKGLSDSDLLEVEERQQKAPSSLDCTVKRLVAGDKDGTLCRDGGQ